MKKKRFAQEDIGLLSLSEERRFSPSEKAFFIFIVFIIPLILFAMYRDIVDSNYTAYEVIVNRSCEDTVALQCPRRNSECRSMLQPPYFTKESSLNLRCMGGKICLLESSKRLRDRDHPIALEILHRERVRCERQSLRQSRQLGGLSLLSIIPARTYTNEEFVTVK